MQHVLGLTPSLCNMTPSSYSGLLPILFHPPNVALIGGQKVDPFWGVRIIEKCIVQATAEPVVSVGGFCA